MNVRQIIDGAINDNAFRSDRTLGHCILDALRAAAGADRVVLAWEPTPCATCRGARQMYHYKGDVTLDCETCGGSGVDGYTVTLETLEQVGRKRPANDRDFLGEQVWFDEFPVFRLVAVSPEPPKDQPCPVGGHHMAKATEDACPACGVSPLGGE